MQDEDFWDIATNCGIPDVMFGVSVQDMMTVVESMAEASKLLVGKIINVLDGAELDIDNIVPNVLSAIQRGCQSVIQLLDVCNPEDEAVE